MGNSKADGIDRRSFLKGAAIAGSAAALATLAGCSKEKGSDAVSENTGNTVQPAYAQAQPKSFPADYIVSPDAEWELFAAVKDSGIDTAIIEGMNFKGDILWFIDVGMSNILKVENGEVSVVYHDEEKMAMPNGAKFINDTTLLIADRRQGLCTFDIETLEYKVMFPGYNGEPFLGLNDIVLDGMGGAYFTDPGQSDYLTKNGNVYYINYEDPNPSVELYKTGFAYPNGITISPDANFLWVAEFNTNSIICVPSKSYKEAKDTPYVAAVLEGGHGPDGVLTDADGNIYAAHLKAGEVAVVDPNGWPIKTIRLPESADIFTTNLAINDGYLYVCEFGQGIIWRILTSAQENPLA